MDVDKKIAQNGSLFTTLVCNFRMQFSIFRSLWVDRNRDRASHLLKGEIPFAFLTHFFNNTTYSVMCGLWIIQVKKSLIYQIHEICSRKADVDWLFYFLILTDWYFIEKRYDVKEWATNFVYWVSQKFKDHNSINALPYTYPCITILTKYLIGTYVTYRYYDLFWVNTPRLRR